MLDEHVWSKVWESASADDVVWKVHLEEIENYEKQLELFHKYADSVFVDTDGKLKGEVDIDINGNICLYIFNTNKPDYNIEFFKLSKLTSNYTSSNYPAILTYMLDKTCSVGVNDLEEIETHLLEYINLEKTKRALSTLATYFKKIIEE